MYTLNVSFAFQCVGSLYNTFTSRFFLFDIKDEVIKRKQILKALIHRTEKKKKCSFFFKRKKALFNIVKDQSEDITRLIFQKEKYKRNLKLNETQQKEN
jgi:hypothetical protein